MLLATANPVWGSGILDRQTVRQKCTKVHAESEAQELHLHFSISFAYIPQWCFKSCVSCRMRVPLKPKRRMV